MVGLRIAGRWGGLFAPILPPMALVACLWALGRQLGGVGPGTVLPALALIPVAAWGAALVCTELSFAAVARFELSVRAALGLAGHRGRAARAGALAVAIAQTLGFGAVSGALARWRALPDLGGPGAARLALGVSVAFLAVLAVWTGAALLRAMGGQSGLLVAMVAVAVAAVLRLRPLAVLPGLSPGCGLGVLAWGGLDLASGAVALAVLLPQAALPDWPVFLAAYLAALLAGVLSQSPGGLGAFEVTLIALLPRMPEAGLLAGLMAYRLVYHLIPAAIALIWLSRPAAVPAPSALVPLDGGALERALARAPQGDWALARSGAHLLFTRDRAQGWLAARAGRHLVAIGAPLGGAAPGDLARHARTAGLAPLLYKCDAATAARARRDGWRVVAVAAEGIIDPRDWRLDSPACSGLRRKLRRAGATGLTIERAGPALPLAEMAAIAGRWAASHGGERGFSMGRFDPALLSRAVIFLARWDGRLAGFVSFNTGRADWTLDLMRHDPDAPDGTMTALVAAALGAARDAGVARLSLAAVPCPPAWLPQAIAARLGAPGLVQFKRSFGPRWQPRYAAAPTIGQLVLGLLAVTRAIHRPAPVPGAARPAALPSLNRAHDDHAENRFELFAPPCDSHPITLRAAGPPAAGARPQPGSADDKRPFPPS